MHAPFVYPVLKALNAPADRRTGQVFSEYPEDAEIQNRQVKLCPHFSAIFVPVGC